MTSHAHETQDTKQSPRPRWLMPALAVGAFAIALVVAGILPLSAALYGGAFGGMMLMHLGGHGAHGAQGGGGHAAHGAADAEADAADRDTATSDTPRRGGCH